MILFIFPPAVQGQTKSSGKVAAVVNQYKVLFPVLENADLFNSTPLRKESEEAILKDYTSLKLDKNALKIIVEKAMGGMQLNIPFKNSSIILELVKVNLFTDDFKVFTDASGNLPSSYKKGIYYRGTIKGEPSSIAAFSFFENDVVGMIATAKGNIIIGRLLNGNVQTEDYIVYSDRDFKNPLSTSCSTFDDPAYAPQLAQLLENAGSLRTDNCVRMYYEADNAIFQSNGSNLNSTVNWITAVHNNVATLYGNDDIKTAISEIFVWTMADPFNATAAITQLNTFRTFRASFNGDVGQLLSIEPGMLGGVSAAINGFCNSENKYAYSDVEFSFATVPAYSWTVNVVAHEFGHLLGSYHTHNCNWPGGAIDNCGPLAGYPNEGGSCLWGPSPTTGGTVMSYCHLTSFGVNFNNGFGPLPGEAIRSAIDASSCLSSSCIPNPPSYCLSKGQSTTSEWIQSVSLANLNMVSGAGTGYSDFTNHTANLQPGSVAAITLTPGYSGTNYDELFSVWIDYNKDLDFLDANEKVFESQPVNSVITGTFAVPAGISGNTRMRVSMKFDTVASTCESFKYGEVEDYTVSFLPVITYCVSYGKKTDREWIDYVKLGSIERSSAADNGYFDGTAIAATLALNSDNSLTFSAGYADVRFNESWKGWIDYNVNGEFENNEIILNKSSNKKTSLTKVFKVPASAFIGITRMRISMKRNESQAACDTFVHGEVEDYSIQIVTQNIEAVGVLPLPLTVQVYPNPATTQITTSFNMPVTSGDLQLINLLGQVVKVKIITSECLNLEMDVSDLTPGIYFMQANIRGKDPVAVKWIRE